MSVEERVKSLLIETTSKRSSSFRRPSVAVVSLEGLKSVLCLEYLEKYSEGFKSAEDLKRVSSIENLRQIVGL